MTEKPNDDERRALLAEIANGATLAFANAEQLFKEAELLASNGATARALFLHQISLEECGKIEMLGAWATSVLANVEVDQAKLARGLANHRSKNSANAYMLKLTEAEQTARKKKDWEGSRAAFNEMKRMFHDESNQAKNAALYVDFDGTRFTSPDATITADMLAKTRDRNAEFLGLMHPKLRMLQRWTETFEDSSDLLDGFFAFAEKLKTQNADAPDEVMRAIMNELRDRMLQKAKAQSDK